MTKYLITAFLPCLFFTPLLARAPSEKQRPNIIFIQADDLAVWALASKDNRDARTPHLNRLFREGAFLRNSFVTTPVCSPSRAGLLTSRFGSELGITDWLNPTPTPERDESQLGLDPKYLTWTKILSRHGYVNGLIGKWHLGTDEHFHPSNFGFQYFTGFRGGTAAPLDPTLEIDGARKKVAGFTVNILTDAAIEFVRRQQSGPFLLMLNYREPHTPWRPMPEEDWAPFADLDPAIPNPQYPDLDVSRVKNYQREYLASVGSLDRSVGRLLAEVERLGLTRRTVIIFTSDNGYNLGHNGIWHKGNGHRITTDARGIREIDARVARPNLYDNSLRVPTAVCWPGVIEPGTLIDETISNLDWYPTLLAMTNINSPRVLLRGRNFWPLLRSRRVKWDNDFYGEYSQHHYTRADLRVYRTTAWKLIRDFHQPQRDELYNLEKDPAENHNLIADPATQPIRRRLNAKLLRKMRFQ